MLLLCAFLLSSCFSGSVGSATEEFQANFKALVDLVSKEIFLPVPAKRFQCHHVPCHLGTTIEELKVYSKTNQMRTYVSLMEKNMEHIIATFNPAHANPEKADPCPVIKVPPQRALRSYQRFFQKLHEHC